MHFLGQFNQIKMVPTPPVENPSVFFKLTFHFEINSGL